MEASEAKDLMDEAIERSEEQHGRDESLEHVAERTFRDRLSVLIGIFAVCLAVVHMAAAGSARDSLLLGIEASDTFAYIQGKIVRETVLEKANGAAADHVQRDAWMNEAKRLRQPYRAAHGAGQLQAEGEDLRREGKATAVAGEGYKLSETALQMAIVLLSIALVARSRQITYGACALAIRGIGCAILARTGLAVFGFA
jgi:hypothetical protein